MGRPSSWRGTRAASLRPLPGIGEPLFVQAPITQAASVADVAASAEIGTVYTLKSYLGRVQTKPADLDAVVRLHREKAGVDAGILIDAGRYAGKSRVLASTPIDAAFIDQQLALGLPWALTDSGYVSETDVAGLHSILQDAARLMKGGKRLIAVLPVS